MFGERAPKLPDAISADQIAAARPAKLRRIEPLPLMDYIPVALDDQARETNVAQHAEAGHIVTNGMIFGLRWSATRDNMNLGSMLDAREGVCSRRGSVSQVGSPIKHAPYAAASTY